MTTRSAQSEGTGGSLAWRERLLTTLQRRGAIVVLVLVVLVSALAFDNFLTAQNLQNIVLQGAFLGLIVVGMTFVIISGGIDLSVGSVLGLGGVIAALAVQVFWPLALILPPLLCGLIGFGNGLLIAKARMAPFIVTLAGLLGIRGLALALAGERPIGIDGVRLSPGSDKAKFLAFPCPSCSWSSPSRWVGWSSRAPAMDGSSSPSAEARSRRG